jgi:LysM repeat protein
MGIKSRLKISLLSLIFLWASTGTGAEVIHILARGETLYSLAREYGVTLDDLLRLNGILDPSDLSVGTRLVIPGEEDLAIPDSGTDYVTYRVSKGDTYYGIARMHGIAVDDLLKMNSRDASRVLRVGETLIVSAGQSASEQHSGGTRWFDSRSPERRTFPGGPLPARNGLWMESWWGFPFPPSRKVISMPSPPVRSYGPDLIAGSATLS